MMDQYIFSASTFGIIAIVVWWIARVVMRDHGGRLRQRLRSEEFGGGAATGARAGVGSILNRVGQAAASPFMPKTRQGQSSLRKQLGYAGIYSPSAIRLMIGCKVLFLAAGLVAGYAGGLLVGRVFLCVSVAGLLAYLLPGVWMKLKVREHQKALRCGLPDALDLMVVCVEAGLTVDAAMQRVGQELNIAHARLSHELEITHMETRVGLARSEALRNLGQRTGSRPIQSLATMLIQAERFGTSVAAALRTHADTLRTQRQHAAEEQAAKASVKLTFPVVLFIFPAVLIVLAGPAAIGLFKSALFAN